MKQDANAVKELVAAVRAAIAAADAASSAVNAATAALASLNAAKASVESNETNRPLFDSPKQSCPRRWKRAGMRRIRTV